MLCFKWRLADEAIVAKLEGEEDEPVLQVERLRSSGGKPMLHTQAHVPAWVGAKFDREALAKGTMLDLLAKSGVTIASASQVMRAAVCPGAIAPLIGLAAGDPVFLIERLVRDDRDRPIQYCWRRSGGTASTTVFHPPTPKPGSSLRSPGAAE